MSRFTLSTCFGGADASRAVKTKYQKWFENGEMRAVVVTDLLRVRDEGYVSVAPHPHVEPQQELLKR